MKRTNFKALFGSTKLVVIGMIHAKPLPGTPLHRNSADQLVKLAIKEAEIYKSAKVDGIVIENMWDLPYVKSGLVGPEITAAMTRIASEVKSHLPSSIPLGVQVLAGANKEALAVCKAAELQFIRAEGFVFSHVADEGWMDAAAGELLRYRKNIDAEHVQIYADIKKKHSSHAVTTDITVAETAKAAEFFLADGVIITGSSTGLEADLEDVKNTVEATTLPTFIGSGITSKNFHKYSTAAGLIVGSYFKKLGKWSEPLDEERVFKFMEKVQQHRMKIISQ